MFSLLLVACNNDTPQQGEILPEKPPLVQEEQNPPSVTVEAEPFAYDEINSIFSMQEKDVLAIYGEPK